eukprot:TRINITY_DN74157_c0_g1_i1.p2 TRINITY_DN74157_c0_g1~~TRINITY_DN74157_c0_g1_i1.p2  ORF type:complete len:243 (+),score=70.22 TRINITY_DN74157_c0_g1_i1:110-838(+)
MDGRGGKGKWGSWPMWWGKGWGKGGWGYGGRGPNRAPPKNTVDDSFAVTPDKRFEGVVSEYKKFQGYGFITPDDSGVFPGDKVFVHWEAIKSSDRFPSLVKDMKVQFSVEKVEKNGALTLKATNVTLPAGEPVALQDAADAEKKEFVGGMTARYTGNMKFFTQKQGFGYVAIDDGFQYGGEDVPKEIRVELAECNAGGANPKDMENTKVEFGIWKTKRGAYKAYNVTLPGGGPLPAAEPATA